MKNITAKGFDYQGLPAAFTKASQKRAHAIVNLDMQTARSIIETGRLFKEQREAFGTVAERKQQRGADSWNSWVQQEIGWKTGRSAANRYIQIYETFGDVGDTTTTNLGYEKMKLLSTRTTNPALRERIIEMAKTGNVPTHQAIEQMKRDETDSDLLPPTEAKKKAQVTGQPVVGSDQRIYTPLDENQSADYLHKRDRTYEIIDSVTFLSTIGIKASAAIKSAEPHWLKDLNLGDIEAAASFLTDLAKAYKAHTGIIDHGN